MAFPITYQNLAAIYRDFGQYDKANEVLQDYIRANPDVARGYQGVGQLMAAWGKYDEAIAAYDRAAAIEPGNLAYVANKRPTFIVMERWTDLEAINQKLLQSPDTRWKYSALMSQADEQLYRGRSSDALRLLEASIASLGARGSTQTASARMKIAGLLIDRQPAAALVAAQRAATDAGGKSEVSVSSVAMVQRLQARLGHAKEADAVGVEIKHVMDQFPSDVVREGFQHGQIGILALDRHDMATAIRELGEADRLFLKIDPMGLPTFELAAAYFDGGNLAEAESRFDKIVNGGVRRSGDPVVFVRSLYFLGRINEQRGDRVKAAAYYKRLVQYWGDGDLDRDRVAEARKKIN